MGINVLYLHESFLPKPFTEGVKCENEMRLIQEIEFVDRIYAVGLRAFGSGIIGENYYVGVQEGIPEPKIDVIHFPLSLVTKRTPLYYLQALLVALSMISRNKINVIHSTSPIWSGPIAVILSRIFKVPCIVEVRTNYDQIINYYYGWLPLTIKYGLMHFLMRFSLINANAVIANSSANKRVCINLGVRLGNVFEVNPGIRFDDGEVDKYKRNRESGFTVGFIGRLIETKGVEYLIRSVSHLIYKKGFGDFRVLIVGDGQSREEFEDLSRELEVDRYVRFVGRVANNLEWISKFDVLVNPTLELEALSMVNVEACACKIPVIAFGKDGLPETVKDGVTGFILEPRDYIALAEKILELHNNPELRRRLGDNGRAYLERRYTFNKQVYIMKRLLQQLGARLIEPETSRNLTLTNSDIHKDGVMWQH